MQGWRISMEDAHATVLDFNADDTKGTPTDKRLAFFGVYDGHGGDKVALYAGEQLHKIVAKQEAFKQGDIKKALQDGFLATDREILCGKSTVNITPIHHGPPDTCQQIPSMKKKCLVARHQSAS